MAGGRRDRGLYGWRNVQRIVWWRQCVRSKGVAGVRKER